MNRPLVSLATLTGLVLIPGSAFAHSLTGSGLTSGILHPLLGLDHLLAMLAIGIWAATQPGRMQLAVPATFLMALLAGFVLGRSGLELPLVETGIALSVLLLGLLLASAVRLPTTATLALTSLFALFHGHAHGAEAVGAAATFAAGFLASSLMLHLAGAALAKTIRLQAPLFTRSLGAAIALSGVWMLS